MLQQTFSYSPNFSMQGWWRSYFIPVYMRGIEQFMGTELALGIVKLPASSATLQGRNGEVD